VIGIYKITNPNGKIYIGQSVDIERRWYHYNKKDIRNQPLLNRSITKYGVENHKFEIVEECNIEQLNEREIYWTYYYNAIHPYGLVLRIGGRSGHLSEEMKRKIGNGNKGKIVSDDTKQKISLSKMGNQYRLNTLHTKETKQKMSKSHIGKKDSEKTKQNKSQSAKGRVKTAEWRQNISNSHPTKKPVEQYNLEGVKINEYISINEAARQTGIRVADISACCNGKQKTAFGFIWKFKT
jgi:group I intron endonuclease